MESAPAFSLQVLISSHSSAQRCSPALWDFLSQNTHFSAFCLGALPKTLTVPDSIQALPSLGPPDGPTVDRWSCSVLSNVLSVRNLWPCISPTGCTDIRGWVFTLPPHQSLASIRDAIRAC